MVRGACGHDCPDTCSWVVEVRDGTAVTLSGDRTHPFTRGTLCAKVNHYLERVYHPDRVLYPLKREGRKGEGHFVRVTWDEALADIGARLQAVAAESGAEAILPYSSAGTQGLIQMNSLDRRLFGSMGCTRLERNICGGVAAAGLSATIGTGTGIDPEQVVHSRFIVLWGTNTIVTNLHFWPLVREAQQRGAKVVVVDPIRTRTAEAAEWHLPIKPASDAAPALAMMHVMVRDDLVDRAYVARHAIGFDALVTRVRDYSPERVAHVVGLPASEIERFAREYATTQPSLLRPLITGKSLHFLNSGYSNQERHRRRAGELLVEIHPDDARARSVETGTAVRVWNSRGEVRAICSVSDRVRPGVAWMPFGGLTDAGGAKRSVNVLTAEEPTDWGGGSGLYDAFVEIAPAGRQGAPNQ
jgi:anaerobic selenocysteine-containing dehydrogenase